MLWPRSAWSTHLHLHFDRTTPDSYADSSAPDSDASGASGTPGGAPAVTVKPLPNKQVKRGNGSQKRFANSGGNDGSKQKYRRPNSNPSGAEFGFGVEPQLGVGAATHDQAAALAAFATSARYLRTGTGRVNLACAWPKHRRDHAGVPVAH